MDQVIGTFAGRWYVTLFGAIFVWRASRDLGWRRTLIYGLSATGLGLLAENASVHFGLPYTTYSFNEELRSTEIWVLDAPLMVAMSYAFMGYFAYAVGRLIASGPFRTRGRVWWHEFALGVMVSTWAIWLFDPIAQRGSQWFLGDLFAYRGPGFWFGLPVGSQVGFTIMSILMVGLLTRMGRAEPDLPVTAWWKHKHMFSALTFHGQLIWLGLTAIWIDQTELGAAALLMWVPAAMITAVFWSEKRHRDRSWDEPPLARVLVRSDAA